MAVYQLDPLRDTRWTEFLERHPGASVFHTPDWLEALRRTYGYRPIVYTTSAPAVDLTNGVVLCRIKSRITGRRMVSLPFSDHCEVLVDRAEDLERLLHSLEIECAREGWKYVEIRPRRAFATPPVGLEPAQVFQFHSIDLRAELGELFRRLHKASTQRKIRRAEREGLTYEEGRSAALLEDFYKLFVHTRRRQRLPPHPKAWFHNVICCLGERVKIRLASKNGRRIAGMITLSYKQALVYKYGCSDERFHNLGGMHLLFWRAIQDGQLSGACEFDLGRSDADNTGLIRFKERWGAAESPLTYWRNVGRCSRTRGFGWRAKVARRVFAHMPGRLLSIAGTLLYRHVG